MATRSRKKSKTTGNKITMPAVRFEIIQEETSTSLGEAWTKLRRQLAPWVEAGRIALGDAYSSLAQVVLEKKEDFEDQQAEQKALKRQSTRQAQKAAKPLLKAGPAKRTRKGTKAKTS